MKLVANTKMKEDGTTSPSHEKTVIKYKKWANPYDLKEAWGNTIRHIFGVDTRSNREIVRCIPHKTTLNQNVDSKFRIGVVGDIMDMMGCRWVPGNDLRQFFSRCAYLLGNFEGTIVTPTQKEPKGVILSFSQRHDINIINSLQKLFDPKKTYLSLANNHAGDFGQLAFERSVRLLTQHGFHVFGLAHTPFIDVDEYVRFITGTQWSNQACDFIFSLDCLEADRSYIDSERFQVLFPHWSYELDLYPRPETIEQGERYIRRYDAVVGHHSHVPQPVTQAVHNAAKTIVAYSLGDICTRERFRKYRYGIALKFDVGLDDREAWVIGDLEWRFTECHPISKTEYETNLIENLPYLPYKHVN